MKNCKMFRLLLLFCYVVYSSADPICLPKCPLKNPLHHVDHYWVDFFGTVPRCAFPGGFDEEGIETYIGQAYIKDHELLPGTIHKGCNTLRTEAYGNTLLPDTNIKILCVKSERKLEWKPTKANELSLLTGCNFVIGGSEIDYTVYIGRTNYHGETIIGKVFEDGASNAGLWIPEKGSVTTEFEILTYGC